ncbi:hypothetical protein [Moryella indoligenes]|uniref:hypothetical protein n=1 Tax=Moryella indoligenes TaxID=371674 RepID=UPI002ED4C9E1
MWKKLDHIINEFFDSYTLADLLAPAQSGKDSVICSTLPLKNVKVPDIDEIPKVRSSKPCQKP